MVQPRHVVCVLGRWETFDAVRRVITKVGGKGFALDLEYSTLEPDARMAKAFDVSRDRVSPSFGEEDVEAVASHSAVAYVLSPPLARHASLELSGRMLGVVAALLDAGGVAVKGESSGIAHGAGRWRELAREYERGDVPMRCFALLSAWVRRPLLDDERGVLHSCGMHLLGERDIELPGDMAPLEATEWIDALGHYLLAEKPSAGLNAGETFRPTAEHPRRVLRARTCERYEEDNFFFNPYGCWNLTELR
jgi:hypothetical protein